jgi:hypothetical protein
MLCACRSSLPCHAVVHAIHCCAPPLQSVSMHVPRVWAASRAHLVCLDLAQGADALQQLPAALNSQLVCKVTVKTSEAELVNPKCVLAEVG